MEIKTNNPESRSGEEAFAGQYGMGMKALVRTMQAAFFLLAMIIVGMLIYFFTFGGYFTVKTQEWVLVAEFGKIQGIAKPGWHWVFPYPVNTIIRIPKNLQTIESSTYLPSAAAKGFGGQNPGAMALEPGRDGYVITGDENIMHIAWALNYRIVDPEKYYLKCLTPNDPKKFDAIIMNKETNKAMGPRGPRTLLKAILDSVVLEVSAMTDVDSLYKLSSDFTYQVEKKFKERLDDSSMDIGVEMSNITLKTSVPAKTKSAFSDVINASQEKDTFEQQAKSYATEQENNAQSESAIVVAESETYKTRVVEEVKADNNYFRAILKEYNASPTTTLVTLYNDKLADSLASVKSKYIINTVGKGQRQEVRLKINPEPKEVKRATNQKQ